MGKDICKEQNKKYSICGPFNILLVSRRILFAPV